MYFAPPLNGFPMNGAWVKKLQWWGYQADWRRKKFDDIFKPCGSNTSTWETDRQTDTERQQRPHLRIALRGKSSKGKGRHWCWSLQQAVSPQVMLDIDPAEGCLPCTGGNHQYPLPVQNYAALHNQTCSISILHKHVRRKYSRLHTKWMFEI